MSTIATLVKNIIVKVTNPFLQCDVHHQKESKLTTPATTVPEWDCIGQSIQLQNIWE